MVFLNCKFIKGKNIIALAALLCVNLCFLLVTGCVYTKEFGSDNKASKQESNRSEFSKYVDQIDVKKDLPEDHGVKKTGLHFPHQDTDSCYDPTTPHSSKGILKCPEQK